MKSFIRRENIAKFRKLLETTTNEEQRSTLLRLLAREKAKAPPFQKRRGDSDDD
jgi:hypothetical protein